MDVSTKVDRARTGSNAPAQVDKYDQNNATNALPVGATSQKSSTKRQRRTSALMPTLWQSARVNSGSVLQL